MEKEKKNIFGVFRTSFMRGIVVIVPIVITITVLKVLFEAVDGIISPVLDALLGYHIIGLGFISMILLILLIGIMSRNLFGRVIIKAFDSFITSLPLARTIYSAIRDLISAFAIGAKSKTFKNVVMVEYPRRGIYCVGFATNEITFQSNPDNQLDVIGVYFPHPPNPTSGVLIFVPKDEIKVLNMTIEEGLKLVLSGGVVSASVINLR
ncbi:MAG: DUF502 domain-containing protein [Bacteroidetes bacterium]|nr:DUF502 domain-containing protein [Bacteroidota bacterium]